MSYFSSISFMMLSTFSLLLRVSMIFSCSVTFLSMKSKLLVTISSWLTIFYSSKDITSAIFCIIPHVHWLSRFALAVSAAFQLFKGQGCRW